MNIIEILVTIFIILVGWPIMGSVILSAVDHNCEITFWKMRSPRSVIYMANMLWPIIATLYLAKLIRHK